MRAADAPSIHPFFYFSAYERKKEREPTVCLYAYKRVAGALIGPWTAGIDGVVTWLNGSNEGHVVGI
jgi:hypothetical protein